MMGQIKYVLSKAMKKYIKIFVAFFPGKPLRDLAPVVFFFCGIFVRFWDSLVAQTVKCLPAMRETRVRSLGQEDPLEKEMATHSSTLA